MTAPRTTAHRGFGAGDVVAGVSVAAVLIPQSLAYAELAGLPPETGLFASALPLLLAAPFVSSPWLQTGPVALTSLLTLGALSGQADAGTTEYVKAAALLALVVGVTRVALGVARLGIVAYLMSEPVLAGFTAGAAILISGSQLSIALGVPRPDGGVLRRAGHTVVHPGEWSLEAVVLAGITVALVLGGRRVHRMFPGVLLAVIGGLVYSRASDYDGPTVGKLPERFPDLSLDLPWDDLGALVVPGIVIALVGFAEPASIARVFAAATRTRWSSNREFVSQGVANIASAVSGGFPVGGSFSRSSLNRFAGARSRWSGAVTGVVVLAFFPFAGILEELPIAILAAIVIAAVAPLIRLGPLVRLWRESVPQAVVGTGTFAATLATSPHVEYGVLIGIGLALGTHLWRELPITYGVERDGTTLRIRPEGVIWFGSTPQLESEVLTELADHRDADVLVIDLAGTGRVDYSGGVVLRRLVDEAEMAGLRVEIVGVPAHARRPLTIHLGGRCGLPAQLDD